MSRVKQIQFKKEHSYQKAICTHARKEFARRLARGNPAGGIILADGVGLGKTYEALGTAVSLLSQLQHGKSRKKKKAFRVMVLVPPSLVSKWSDELILPERFPKYLSGWVSPTTRAVAQTFEDVVVLRRAGDLMKAKGEVRYGRRVMPPGLYIVNSNVLRKEGRRVGRLRSTRWDVIIVDEAHHVADELVELLGYEKWRGRKTALLLLTATPFQMSPQEMKGLLAVTFCGEHSPTICAQDLYSRDRFATYRKNVTKYFKEEDENAAKEAIRLAGDVRDLLLPRMVRNRKADRRAYHLVDESGNQHRLPQSPFGLTDSALDLLLRKSGLVKMSAPVARIYLNERDQISQAAGKTKNRPFVSAALRQLLSSWQQYANSHFGREKTRDYEFEIPLEAHPKAQALSGLIRNLLKQELEKAVGESLGKILIFTSYVGSEGGPDRRSEELGTAASLKRQLTKVLNGNDEYANLFPKSDSQTARRIKLAMHKVLTRLTAKDMNLPPHDGTLSVQESRELKRTLSRFAGSSAANFSLADKKKLDDECRVLKRLLSAVIEIRVTDSAVDETRLSEGSRRLAARRNMLFKQVLDRYSTLDLVARYDGRSAPEERDRHLRGFNSPFAPFVLIASSVGQEGIDLQKYCRHVVHYDLEWNPAKLEQREGRVDRKGRKTDGPVNVYFLLCSGTYDERLMHVMTNRFRWHQVLLGHKTALQHEPAEAEESNFNPAWLVKMMLNLAPPGAPRAGVAS